MCSKISKSKKNIIASLLMQLITICIGLVLPKLIIENYGSNINGLISTVNTFFVYFNILEGGVAVAAGASLYSPIKSNDYEQINRILSAVRNFYIKSGLLFVCITIAFSVFFKSLSSLV